MSDTATVPESKTTLGRLSLPGFVAEAARLLSPPAIRLAGAGIQFFSTVMIARQLGDVNSAAFFFWSAILTSFTPIATYGLEHLALRTAPRLQRPERASELISYLSSLRTFSLILSLVIGSGLLIYAWQRSEGSPGGFAITLLLLPITLSAMALVLINGESLKGLSKPVAGVFFGHFVPVSLFFLLIVSNLERLSSPFLLGIYAIAYIAAVLVFKLCPSTILRARTFKRPERRKFHEIVTEGFPVFATNALGALCFITPLMILDFSRPASEVAYVTTSFRISILFSILAGAIHGVFAPQLSRAAETPRDSKALWRVYRKATLLTFLALLVPFSIGIAFPKIVMSVFGEEFQSGADTLRLLLVAGLLTLCLGPMLHLLLMTGNTRLLARLGILKLVLVSALSLVIVPLYGGIGMVCVIGGAFLLEAGAGLFIVRRQLHRQTTQTHHRS